MVKYSADTVFAALAHPVRRRIVERLSGRGRVSLSRLARPFPMSLPAVMKHAAILEECGVIVSSKEGRVRYYAVNAAALLAGMNWFKTMEKTWGYRFDRLERHLKAVNKK